MQHFGSVACPMHRCAVSLKDKFVIHNVIRHLTFTEMLRCRIFYLWLFCRYAVTLGKSFTHACVPLYWPCSEAGKLTTGLAESNGNLLLGLWLTLPVGCPPWILEISTILTIPRTSVYLTLPYLSFAGKLWAQQLVGICHCQQGFVYAASVFFVDDFRWGK